MKYADNNRGFTIVELMLTVAIIGVLSAIAIPAYQNYAIRSQVSEGFQLVAASKTAVTETFLANNAYPTSNGEAGLPPLINSQYVSSIAVGNNGNITITYDTNTVDVDPAENTIVFAPTFASGGVQWTCTGGSMLDEFRPDHCR